MKNIVLLIVFSLPFINSVQADIFGASDMKVITELQAMYETMMKTLQEAKAQNAKLSSVKSSLIDIMDTKDYVENFSADQIARRIERDFENVTELDDLSGMSERQKIRALRRLLKRRIDDPDTDEETRRRLEREQALLEDIEMRNEILEEISKNSNRNLQKSSTDLSSRDSNRITAESLSALAQIESQRALEENKLRKERIGDNKALYELNQQSQKILKNTEQGGW